MDFYPQLRQIIDLPATFTRDQDTTWQKLMASFAAALTLGSSSNLAVMQQTNFLQAINGWIDVWGGLPGIQRRFQEPDAVYQQRLLNMILAARDSSVAIELWLGAVEGVSGQVSTNYPAWGYTVNIPDTLTPLQLQRIVNDLAYVRPAGMPFKLQASTGGTYLNTVNYFGPIKTLSPGTSGVVDNVPTPWNYGRRAMGSWLINPSGSATSFVGTINYLGSRSWTTPRFVPTSALHPWNFGGRVTGAWFASKITISGSGISAATNNQLSTLPTLLLTDPTINPSLSGLG
jgi:hypothetical protein